MKRLSLSTLPYFLIISILTGCNNKKASSNVSGNQTDVIEIVTYFTDSVKSEEYSKETDDNQLYRGNLKVEYGNIKVYANYGLSNEYSKYGDDIIAKDETYLIRYVDDVPRDTMVLKGPYNSLLGKSHLCKITVGTDTVNVNISKPLNKYLDLRFTGVLPGCRFYRYSKHYSINNQSSPTDFQINLALPSWTPKYILDIISESIRDDVAVCFGDYTVDDEKYPDIPLFKISNNNIPQMMRYYYNKFREYYFKDQCGDESQLAEAMGTHYSVQNYIYPVWQSTDGNLTTWKFYSFHYLGGAHGTESEYFFTFDRTGRILGAKDFYTDKEFKQAIDILAKQLNAYHDPYGEWDAELQIDPNLIAEDSITIKEVIDSKVYPRPALTRQGIVFSYQTYEKGYNPDGILHFTQPYGKNLKLKQ